MENRSYWLRGSLAVGWSIHSFFACNACMNNPSVSLSNKCNRWDVLCKFMHSTIENMFDYKKQSWKEMTLNWHGGVTGSLTLIAAVSPIDDTPAGAIHAIYIAVTALAVFLQTVVQGMTFRIFYDFLKTYKSFVLTFYRIQNLKTLEDDFCYDL